MATNGDNLFFGPLANYRTLLASCRAYQLFVGIGFGVAPFGAGGFGDAAAVAAAQATIHCPALPPPDSGESVVDQRPFSVIGQGDDFRLARQSTTCLPERGSLIWLLEANVPAAYTPADKKAEAEQWFMEAVGDILEDLAALANTSGYLAVSAVRLADGPRRSDTTLKKDEGDFYQVVFVVEWGAVP
jgi:hypothetical protein